MISIDVEYEFESGVRWALLHYGVPNRHHSIDFVFLLICSGKY